MGGNEMELVYVPELRKIGKVLKYTSSITGGKYLIEIEGSESYFRSKAVTLLNKKYSNQELWHLADYKLIPDGAEFRNYRGYTMKFIHEKFELEPTDNPAAFDEIYKLNDKWYYVEVE